MGGKALSQFGIQTIRCSTSEHEAIAKELVPRIKSTLNVEIKTVKYYHTKESHGDLDLLIKNTGNLPNIKEYIKKEFGTDKINANGGVYSFAYKNYQIDLILVKEEDFETTPTYYNYDPSGNLMGKLAKMFHLKYGIDGLVFPFRGFSGTVSKNIVITKDNRTIFEFLGLNYDRYLEGFETVEDVFEFIIASKYFNVEKFQFENLGHVDRKRNLKRSTYNGFLEYVKTMKPESKFERMSLEESIDFINESFPEVGLKRQFVEFEEYNRKLKENAEKFNGKIVMELTGLSGKELGDFIKNFKASFENFVEFVNESSKEEIIERINEFK